MPHVFEPASSGRSKCRGCGLVLQKGELRFGERLPNPFGDGEVTHWFHPACAAYKRPEALLEGLQAAAEGLPGSAADLERKARAGLAHRRLARIDGAERAPGSQAKCRQCHQLIGKGDWRIRLVLHEEGTFSPGGFIHLGCREAYFECGDILEQVLHFSPALDADGRAAIEAALR